MATTAEQALAGREPRAVTAVIVVGLGAALGWAAGQLTRGLGWLAVRLWAGLTLFTLSIAYGFRIGVGLPAVPAAGEVPDGG